MDSCFEPLQFSHCFVVGRGLVVRVAKEPFAFACSHQERYTFQSWMTGKHSVMTRVVSDAKRRSGQHMIGNCSALPSVKRHVLVSRLIGSSAPTSANRRARGNQSNTDSANHRARGNQSTGNSARIRVDHRTRSNLSIPGKQRARRNAERQVALSVLPYVNHRMLSPEPVRR